MKDTNNKNLSEQAAKMKRMNFSKEEEKSRNNPIPASDANRNDERDRRIKEEQDTARLRSEKDSVKEKNNEQ